jgi:AcrR family transcriptional regulator
MSTTKPQTAFENVMDVESTVDGRTLSTHRNRTAVIVALLDLIREGNLDPSTSDIADRAGVSDRSIFRYFDDLDDLVHTTIGHALREAKEFGRIEDFGNGTFDERVDRFVDSRIRVLTYMDGAMRVARMRAYLSPAIDDEFNAILEYSRRLVRRQFAPELERIADDVRDSIVDAIVVFATYDTYAIHWRMLRHSVEETRVAVSDAIRALLSGPPPATTTWSAAS